VPWTLVDHESTRVKLNHANTSLLKNKNSQPSYSWTCHYSHLGNHVSMYFQVQCMILTHDYPIEIYINAFHLRHLCIPTRLVKATHNIKTSLIKQCYTWYAWLGLLGLPSPTMLITAVLLCLLLLYYCTTVDVCSILHALCSVLDQYIFHYCIMLKLCSC
jgi:hypothetical protein